MTKYDVKIEYLKWLYDAVFDEHDNYIRLATILHDIPFTYILDRDENRAMDGIELRYKFMCANSMYDKDYEDIFGDEPCSVFEMLVALAVRIEDQFMDNLEDYRVPKWFSIMLTNLGLAPYTDSYFNNWGMEYEVKGIIDNFLNRTFKPDGYGSIFTTKRDVDMRDVEFWCQATWYLSDNCMNEYY